MMSCTLVATTPTGPHWTALDCAVHGRTAAYADRALPDQDAAVANAWAGHLALTERHTRIQRESAARLATPYAPVCTHDTGAMHDCAPACTAPTRWRVAHETSCYGWFVADVCDRHRGSTLGRVHPDQTTVTEIPRRTR